MVIEVQGRRVKRSKVSWRALSLSNGHCFFSFSPLPAPQSPSLLPTYSFSLFITGPYYLNILSCTFFYISPTLVFFLICSLSPAVSWIFFPVFCLFNLFIISCSFLDISLYFVVPLILALLILSSFVAPNIIYTIILLKSVAVSKLQVTILARLSREISQTVHIDSQ